MGGAPVAATFPAVLFLLARRPVVLSARRFSSAAQSYLKTSSASAAVAEALLPFQRQAPLVRACGATQISKNSTSWRRAAAHSASVVRARAAAIAGNSLPAALHTAAASIGGSVPILAGSTTTSARVRSAHAVHATTATTVPVAAPRKALPTASSTTVAALYVTGSEAGAEPGAAFLGYNRFRQLVPRRKRGHTRWPSTETGLSFHHRSTCSSSSTPPVTLRSNSTSPAAAGAAPLSPRGSCYSPSCLDLQWKARTNTSSTAAHVQAATAAAPAVTQRDDSIHHDTDSERCHAALSIGEADSCGRPPSLLIGDNTTQVGVLLLRKASDRKCFSKRSRRNVLLVFSNEVHSVTFPDSSSSSSVDEGGACTSSRTIDELADSSVTTSSSNSSSARDIVGLSSNRRAKSVRAWPTNSVSGPATALSSCGSGQDSTGDGGGSRSTELDNSEAAGISEFDVRADGSGWCNSEYDGDSESDSVVKTLKKRSRSRVNGLVYIEDDEGTRYGIGYTCPRHPLIAARVLTQDINEDIDAAFFFHRMQAALRQRQALQEAFDWLGWPGSVSVSARDSTCERSSGTNSVASNSSTGSYGAGEGDSSAYLESACSSRGRNGTKRGKPPETMPDAASHTSTGDELAAAARAERGAAQADTGARTTLQIQVKVTEKKRSTDYFRLINGAGDLLPGVVIDLYGEYASIQLLTCGIDFLLPLIVEALHRLLPLRGVVVRLEHPDRLLEHPQQQLREQHALEKPISGRRRDGGATNGEAHMDVNREKCTSSTSRPAGPLNYLRYCLGEHFAVAAELPRDLRCLSFGSVPDTVIIEENGCFFPVNLLRGGGTGWLYDRREFRRRVALLSTRKRVLDLFCSSGGSAITTVRMGGAYECVGVCSDERSLQLALQAISLNGLRGSSSNSSSSSKVASGRDTRSDLSRNTREGRVKLVQADEFDWLAEAAEKVLGTKDDEAELFDVVVLDPPNWACRSSDLLQQRQKQQELVARAALLTAERGILAVTCSSRHYCAAGVRFFTDVQVACASAGKTAVLRGEGSSGPDFPTDVSLSRSRDLFWVLLQLERR